MRDHSAHIELTREEAVSRMLDKLKQCGFASSVRDRREIVPLDEAFGRVLATDVCAKTDIPNVLSCCLDSVALRWSDFENLAPGELPDTSTWTRGEQWQFANTGVAMPEGFDTAVVIEHVEVSADESQIRIKAAPTERFAGTRAAGSTRKRGELVQAAGCIITPDIAASIASAGHTNVSVLPRARVSFIPTGDELVPANLPYSPQAPERFAGYGHVYESNSVVVKGKTEAWGGSFRRFDTIPDDYESIKNALLEAVATSDIVVLNAGSSKGSDDWSVEVLDEIGCMICHQVTHGPGHHSFYAIVDGTPVVGLSGPSGGVSFTLEFYLRPVMRAFFALPELPLGIPARLRGSFGDNKFAAEKQPQHYAGEKRPPEANNPGDVFYSVRFMELSVDEKGALWAAPVKGKAGSAQTQHANAIYLLENGLSAQFPVEGDVIKVQLRECIEL